MAQLNAIVNQMNEFQRSKAVIEDRFGIILNTVKEMLSELDEAKSCLTTAASVNLSVEELEEVNEFKERISNAVYKECDLIKDAFEKINNLINESQEFERIERTEIRTSFQQNPIEFDENELKKLATVRAVPDARKHPKYAELVELIQNTREGVTSDLVMAEPNQNQMRLCPITRQAIKNPCKNAVCDHVYEKEAIMNYIKGRSHFKNCPVSGCPKKVVLA